MARYRPPGEDRAPGTVRAVGRRRHRRGDARAWPRRRAAPARRLAADRRRRGMTTSSSDAVSTVALVGGGVVADRLRSVGRDRYRFVEPDVSAPIVVLASAGPHAELAAAYLERGVHVVSTSGSSHDVRDLLELDDRGPRGRRQPRRRRRRLARPERPVRPPSGRIDERVRRAARRRPRHRRPGVRSGAPPLVPRLGDRLARRSLDRAPRRQWPRAVLVPRAGRCPRQLSRRDARSVAAPPQLPCRAAHQRPAVGDASRPGHGTAADAQPAAPRGRRRRIARRGRAARRKRASG